MTRARMINVGGVAQRAALSAVVAAHLALNPTAQSKVIENRGQAMPKGAQRAIRQKRVTRKASTRAATVELVAVSNATLVVSHLHPRWLRAMVNEAMDVGATITNADVDIMRHLGEAEARKHYWGYFAEAEADDIQYVDGHGPLTRAQRDALQAEFSNGR